MRRATLLVLLLLAVPAVFAASDQDAILFASEAELDAALGAPITLIPREQNPSIQYVQADLFFYPRASDDQAVLGTSTTPEADFNGSRYRFTWTTGTDLHYSLETRLRVRAAPEKVRSKVPYPIPHLPAEFAAYTEPAESIDTGHPAIRAKALELAAGEDDLFFLAAKIGNWVRGNIYYNLSTLTAEVSQSASWVLENRIGVCDELTSLFIALLRALDVPARYVSGPSYTNSPLFPDRWGPHGWAEVYFPGAGWVPFDVTFGEYGYVDPGHLKMFEGMGPGGVSTRFEWRGHGYTLEPAPLDTDVAIRSITPAKPVVAITVAPYATEVGFGSQNLVTASVQSHIDAYLAVELALARVDGLAMRDPAERLVVLRPGERRTVAWRIGVPRDLSKRFLYTFPLVVSARGVNGTSQFKAVDGGEFLNQGAVDALVDDLTAAEEPRLELGCVPRGTAIYPNERMDVACELRNRGAPLEDVRVCLGASCETIDIGEDARVSLTLPIWYTAPGKRTLAVTAQAAGASARALVTIDMEDFPAVRVARVTAPARVGYGEQVAIEVLLEKESYAAPVNLSGTVRVARRVAAFTVPRLNGEHIIRTEVDSRALRPGNNTIEVALAFKDRNGKAYAATGTGRVELVDVTLWERVKLFFRRLVGI